MESAKESYLEPGVLTDSYKNFIVSLNADEREFLEDARWDEKKDYLKGLQEFLEANNDGSQEAEEQIRGFSLKLQKELAAAEKTGNEHNLKFYTLISRIKLPVDVTYRESAENDEKSEQKDSNPQEGGSSESAPNKTSQEPSEKKLQEELKKQAEAKETQEQHKSINVEQVMENILDSLDNDEKKALKDELWKEGSYQKWKYGFLEYIKYNVYHDGKELSVGGKNGFTVLKDYYKDHKRTFENTLKSADPHRYLVLKAQKKVMEKLLGVFTGTEKKEEQEGTKNGNPELTKIKQIWSWKNIKATLLNIRNQIGGLVGWTPSQQATGMAEIETRAIGKPASSGGVYDQLISKKTAANDNAATSAHHKKAA